MADRSALIWSGFWEDDIVESWSAHQKLLFIYLFSTRQATASGVYRISRTRIARDTAIPPDVIDKNLITEPMQNISYDAHHKVAFVHNRLRYNRRGSPLIIVKSVIGDYVDTRQASIIWKQFRNIYREDIMSNADLHNVFFGDNALDGSAIHTPMLLGATPLTPYMKGAAVDLTDAPGAIQSTLNEFVRSLHQDDSNRILRLYQYFTEHKKSGKELAVKTRLRIAETMASHPAEQLAKAAFLFDEADGIKRALPFAYFEKICDGSAKVWYEEFEALKQKHEEGDDGRRHR